MKAKPKLKSIAKRRYPKNIKPKRENGTPEVATNLRWAGAEERQYVARAAQSLDVSLSNFCREAAIARANSVLGVPCPSQPPVASPSSSIPA